MKYIYYTQSRLELLVSRADIRLAVIKQRTSVCAEH